MEKFFLALKIIAYIVLKEIAFHIGLFIAFIIASLTGIDGLVWIIFSIIFSCIPAMIIIKVKDYSRWWIAADIIFTSLFLFLPTIF